MLIVAPTRELAQQVHTIATKLTKVPPVRAFHVVHIDHMLLGGGRAAAAGAGFSITGIFCSPVKTATTEGELFTLQHDSNHHIGLVNLSLDNGNNKDDEEVLTQVKKAEESFIKRIRELLETSA